MFFGMPMPLLAKSGGLSLDTPLGTFIEGGYLSAFITYGTGETYALISAPKAQGQSATNLAYRNNTQSTAGATSSYDGVANTDAIIATGATHPAASYCVGLTINGYADWYLAAPDELIAISPNYNVGPAGEAWDTDLNYWSSQQAFSSNAYTLLMPGTSIAAGTKTTLLKVRAIRRVLMS